MSAATLVWACPMAVTPDETMGGTDKAQGIGLRRRIRAGIACCVAALMAASATSTTAREYTWRYWNDDTDISFLIGHGGTLGVLHALQEDFDGDGSTDLTVCGDHRSVASSGCMLLPSPVNVPAGTAVDPFANELPRLTLATGKLGREIAAGDLNGDGRADFVASATNSFANIFVFFGPFPANVDRRAEDLNGQNGFALRLAPETEYFVGGLTVLDFDGDAAMDLAVGQPGKGRALVLRGRTAWPAMIDFLATEPSADPNVIEIGPIAPVINFYQRMLGARLDGDQLDDLVIVDGLAEHLYIIRGTTTPPPTYGTSTLSGDSGRSLHIGRKTGGASGDFNGDGRVDLAFMASSGVQVLFGRADGALPGATWPPVESDGYFHPDVENGFLEAVPDLNGDGRDELALTIMRDTGTNGLVLFGRASPGTAPACFNGEAGLTLLSPGTDYAYHYPGERLFGLEDLDGDGLGDLMVHGRVIYSKRLKTPFADGFGAPCG